MSKDMMIRQFFLLLVVVFFLVACAQESQPQISAEVTEQTADGAIIAGDAVAGQRIYIFCQSCHSINEGGANKIGPNLHGIFNQKAARVEGFMYSAALSSADITWTADMLDQWVARPAALVPGTTMVFAGVNDPQQRADLIAYLQASGVEN
ncbi:MAG: cytochrome c family protein [Gammaproteobacteria bacterium]|nr:cytochrome c family protein [Gammaproteobacteria bacterium]